MKSILRIAGAGLLALLPLASAVHLFETPGDVPGSVRASCRAALAANITCTELMQPNRPGRGLVIEESELTDYCVSDCHDSLSAFVTNVGRRCADVTIPMNETDYSATDLAGSLQWAYDTACLTDRSTKGFCYPDISEKKSELCSDCFLQYEASLLSSNYGAGRINPPSFSKLLSSCGAASSSYTYQTPTATATKSSSASSTPAPTCTGTMYTVKGGDTCHSIASANSVADDLLILDNKLDYGCNTLKEGNTLCLPQSCKLLEVTEGMTCKDILAGKSFYKTQLLSWNPSIHPACNNLDVMVGKSICVSPPGSKDYEVSSYPTPTSTSFTMFTGSFVTGDTASPAPTDFTVPVLPTTFSLTTATTTVNVTQASIIDDYSEYCPITGEDYDNGFEWDDLAPACSNLLEPYCTPDPNADKPTSKRFPANCTPTTTTDTATATNTAGAKPSPITPGTIDSCKAYYKVAQSDTCFGIATNYNISIDQFNKWNPYAGDDCKRLLLAYYVCVSA